MKCISPFQMVDGLGCLWYYMKHTHNFVDGLKMCESKGGDMFEFENFDAQQQSFYNYLTSKGGIYE